MVVQKDFGSAKIIPVERALRRHHVGGVEILAHREFALLRQFALLFFSVRIFYSLLACSLSLLELPQNARNASNQNCHAGAER